MCININMYIYIHMNIYIYIEEPRLWKYPNGHIQVPKQVSDMRTNSLGGPYKP